MIVREILGWGRGADLGGVAELEEGGGALLLLLLACFRAWRSGLCEWVPRHMATVGSYGGGYFLGARYPYRAYAPWRSRTGMSTKLRGSWFIDYGLGLSFRL